MGINHFVKDDVAKVQWKTDIVKTFDFYVPSMSFNVEDLLIRPDHVYLQNAYENYPIRYGHLSVMSCYLYRDYSSDKCEVIEYIKKMADMLLYPGIMYNIVGNAREFIDALIDMAEGNQNKKAQYYDFFKPNMIKDNRGLTMHIGIYLPSNNVIGSDLMDKLKKIKQYYNVKWHIMGLLSLSQYQQMADIVDYVYIGRPYIQDGPFDNVSAYNRNNIFNILPFNINYAKLIYDCHIWRTTHTDRSYPKIVAIDEGYTDANCMTTAEQATCFLLGADYLMSAKIYLNSTPEQNVKYKERLRDLNGYSSSQTAYVTHALNETLSLICNLCGCKKLSYNIETLHKLGPVLLDLPWEHNNIQKSPDKNKMEFI